MRNGETIRATLMISNRYELINQHSQKIRTHTNRVVLITNWTVSLEYIRGNSLISFLFSWITRIVLVIHPIST